MRTILAITLATLTLGACAPKMEDGSKAPEDPMREMSRTSIGFSTRLLILRDGQTGCDYLSADGDSANALRPRTRQGGAPVCGGGPATGFAIVSVGDLPGIDLVRVRDKDTGCDWFWADGEESGDLSPVLGADGRQTCSRQGS